MSKTLRCGLWRPWDCGPIWLPWEGPGDYDPEPGTEILVTTQKGELFIAHFLVTHERFGEGVAISDIWFVDMPNTTEKPDVVAWTALPDVDLWIREGFQCPVGDIQ